MGTWICWCKPQQSQGGRAVLLCAKSSWMVFPHRSCLYQQHGEVHTFGNFLMDLQTPRAAVLSPTRMSAQSKLLVRWSQASLLAPRLAVFPQYPNLLPYDTSNCKAAQLTRAPSGRSVCVSQPSALQVPTIPGAGMEKNTVVSLPDKG